MKIPVSDNLRTALRDHGWWKLASQVKTAQGHSPPAEVTLPSAVEALAMKLAADRATRLQIRAGLDALGRVRGGTMRPQYAVREAWDRFKAAALAPGVHPAEAVGLASLAKWAEHEAGSPGGPRRDLREALASSVAGAALVDHAVEKLAAQGRYTPDERDYLLDLNAEAAVRDLRALLKTSSALDAVTGFVQRHPTGIGAGLGALVGGGIGAMKDEDNPARGALAYGVPGAAMGALAGHGAGQWHGARQLASQEQARKLVDDTADATQATHDWNFKLHQGREWGKEQDAVHSAKLKLDAERATQAAQQVQTRKEDAHKFVGRLYSAAHEMTRRGSSDEKSWSMHFLKQLSDNEESVRNHAAQNPHALHASVVNAMAGDGHGVLAQIMKHVDLLKKHGN